MVSNVDQKRNLIPNGDFSAGVTDDLPEGWSVKSLEPNLTPVFKVSEFEGKNAIEIRGGGNPNCIGHIFADVKLERNETYRYRVVFHITDDINPAQNLRFSYYSKNSHDFNNGIFKFTKLGGNWVSGENSFYVPGEGELAGEARITFLLNGTGTVYVREISLVKTDPIPARPVRVACSQGSPAPGTWKEKWTDVFDRMENKGIDVFLLPEIFNDDLVETADGEAARFMSEQARRHHMYVSGTTLYRDPSDGFVYNTAFLFDRNGKKAGEYRKNHPFSDELNLGVLPGNDVPVFDTDFGKVGIMVCYDSWFGDVAELLALKGAEIILFPNASYYISLMPARSADNCVRIAASSLDGYAGIWDTSGANVINPDADPSRHANCDKTFNSVTVDYIGEIKVVTAVLDFSQSPSPHNWGGPMVSAPGGRRNRREQIRDLHEEIQREINRWWD